MSTIGTLGPTSNELASLLSATKQATADAAQAVSEESKPAEPVVGIKVSLSGVGLQKAASEKSDNSDIAESGLPPSVQQTLVRIRELKQQIAEKMAELQALMADQSITPEDKQARVGAIQTTLAVLNAGLMTANAALEKASKSGVINEQQTRQAAVLAMKS